jgi:hypothetical protein
MDSVFAAVSPHPVPDRDSEAFWAACARHELLVRHCNACGRGHYPPGPLCPWCTSDDVVWVASPGRAHVRSHVTFRHAFLPALAEALPYTVVKVTLDDHPDALLHGRLHGATDVAIGAAVELVWDALDGGPPLPDWRLVEPA